jgi:peptidyl-prolyl cis-trans isomerase D
MFDFVHENKKLAQIILALISLPFILFGVNYYWHSGGGDAVATVEGVKITQEEFDDAMRQQQAQLQQMLGGRFDPAMFDTPLARQAVLDELVNQRLMAVKARSAGLAPTDAQLVQMISGFKAFQKDGKFDQQRYQAVLRSQNMTPQMLEARLRDDLASEQLTEMYQQNGYASKTAADNLIRINEQQRTVRVAHIALDSFLAQVRVDDAAVKKYYEDNQPLFRTPERARVEYVVFSAAALQPQMTVGAQEIDDYYKENPAEFTTPEQRHALHILIAPKGSGEAEVKAAHDKAEAILQQLRQAPGKFAELAKKNSDDPGSAAKGGDLGYFPRGRMAKPFEDAVFALQPGQLSDVVQTQYGFHIIKLVDVKAPRTAPLDEVKAVITQKLKMIKASNEFAKLTDSFYDQLQNDSLKPAAELAKAQVQQSGWLERGQPGGYPWTEKALEAAFSEDVLKKHRNSSAIEIAPDTLLAVRLLDYKPAGARPLEEVSGAIRTQLQRQQASELAAKQGQAVLAQLQKGEKPALKWSQELTISRLAPGAGMDPQLARQVLQADVAKLPVYVGAASAQGYDIASVDQVKDAGTVDDAQRARYEMAMREAVGEELLSAFMAEARKHASISVKELAAKGKS